MQGIVDAAFVGETCTVGEWGTFKAAEEELS